MGWKFIISASIHFYKYTQKKSESQGLRLFAGQKNDTIVTVNGVNSNMSLESKLPGFLAGEWEGYICFGLIIFFIAVSV